MDTMKRSHIFMILFSLVIVFTVDLCCAATAYSDSDMKYMIDLVNQVRSKSQATKGQVLLVEDPILKQAAQQYALELANIVESGLDAVIPPHKDRAYSTPRMRMTRAGFNGSHWGENEVVTAVKDIKQAQMALEASSTHRNNMLENYDKIGIASAMMSCARVPRLPNLIRQGRCRDLCDNMAGGQETPDSEKFLYFIVQDFGRSVPTVLPSTPTPASVPVSPPSSSSNSTLSSPILSNSTTSSSTLASPASSHSTLPPTPAPASKPTSTPPTSTPPTSTPPTSTPPTPTPPTSTPPTSTPPTPAPPTPAPPTSHVRPVYTPPPSFNCSCPAVNHSPFVPIYSPTLHLNFGSAAAFGVRPDKNASSAPATASPGQGPNALIPPASAPPSTTPLAASSMPKTLPEQSQQTFPSASPPGVSGMSPYVPVMARTGNRFELKSPQGNVILKVCISQ